MQDKNDINAMAKKYKEEMMLAYSKKRIGGNPPGSAPHTPKKEEKGHIPAPAPKIKQIEDAALNKSKKDEKKSAPPAMPVIPEAGVSSSGPEKCPEKDLEHPPMPKIPRMEDISSSAEAEKNEENKSDDKVMPVIPKMEAVVSGAEECSEKNLSCPPMPSIPSADDSGEGSEKWKFLTAEELIKRDSEAGSDTVPDTDEPHHQGNYDFSTAPDKQYKEEVKEFESEHGEGYLQVEVTCGENSCPIEGAAIAITAQAGDMDTLIATLVTGTDGSTEAVTLPSNGHKYMVTVYKEGFFTVRDLPVPIFDTIKSIQPVTMTEIGNKV
ncbi:MAG: hypothetical protein J1E40_04475 [Oscillospiraceae bacterium]|nr:hypothetical protein [Oscillospiraceae bacterium]